MNGSSDVVSSWLAHPMPASPADASLSPIHETLASLDAWVAVSVIDYLAIGRWHVPPRDILRDLSDVRADLGALPRADGDRRSAAEQYEVYADLLRDVFETFLGWRETTPEGL